MRKVLMPTSAVALAAALAAGPAWAQQTEEKKPEAAAEQAATEEKAMTEEAMTEEAMAEEAMAEEAAMEEEAPRARAGAAHRRRRGLYAAMGSAMADQRGGRRQ